MQTIAILDNLSKIFSEDQAKAIVMALEEFDSAKQHVTKDLLDASLHLQSELLTSRLKDTEIRLIKWVIGLMIAQTSITIATIKMIG